MRGGHSIGRSPAESVEHPLQLVTPGDDDPHTDHAEIKEQPEVVQVSVEEGVFVVPLHLHSHVIPELVHFVRWGLGALAIHHDLGQELPLVPSPIRKTGVNLVRNSGLVPATHDDSAFPKPEPGQHRDDVGPFVREIPGQHRRSMAPLMNLIVVQDESRQVRDSQRPTSGGYRSLGPF